MLQNGVPQFVGFCRCTPCRQRRGKALCLDELQVIKDDAPRAGSAEAKPPPIARPTSSGRMHPVQAAPRQSSLSPSVSMASAMHPVQAAPRQSQSTCRMCIAKRDAPRAGSAEAKRYSRPVSYPSWDAPRAGSAEAKYNRLTTDPAYHDAPRAGSAEAKIQAKGKRIEKARMHPVQAAPRQS